ATAPVQIIDGDTFGSGSSVSWVLNDRELLDGDQFAFWAEGSGTKTLKDWQFAIIPIPEPSAFGGIFGLSAIALVMRRRRVAK
ncbi:MAG: PEP-CTERM sorting domain-containing protein, partial [Verrucomicrobiota bacterium]